MSYKLYFDEAAVKQRLRTNLKNKLLKHPSDEVNQFFKNFPDSKGMVQCMAKMLDDGKADTLLSAYVAVKSA